MTRNETIVVYFSDQFLKSEILTILEAATRDVGTHAMYRQTCTDDFMRRLLPG